MNVMATLFLYFIYFCTSQNHHSCVTGHNYNDDEYFCDNLYYADKSVLQNIHKCFCEPYNKTDFEGKPSIVRFPVNYISFKILL